MVLESGDWQPDHSTAAHIKIQEEQMAMQRGFIFLGLDALFEAVDSQDPTQFTKAYGDLLELGMGEDNTITRHLLADNEHLLIQE